MFRHHLALSLWILGVLPAVFGADPETECVQDWLRKRSDLLDRFRPDQLDFLCKRSSEWSKAATNPVAPISDFLTPDQLAYLMRLSNCAGSDCLQLIGSGSNNNTSTPSPPPTSTLRLNVSEVIIDHSGPNDIKVVHVTPQTQSSQTGVGGSGGGRVTRKEYRTLTDAERNRYHAAIQKLKSDKVDGISKYDLLVIYHTPQEAPEAHWGPAFLPFHREYLKQFELALRQVDPSIAVPYWDSTLDEGLPNPRDSILWTPQFLGTADGPVTDGPFAGWTALQILPNTAAEKRLIRQVGGSPYGGLYRQSDIDFILSRPRFEDLTSCIDPTFEITHGLVHSFVGGYMLEVSISPNDPSFFLHHSFIDFLWHKFRQTRQTSPGQRETAYPTNEQSCNEFHYSNARMKPFPIKNVDGLSERYTNELYQYDERPSCKPGTSSCVPDSPYLFCDRRINRCLSKVQPRGNCSGSETQDICYQSTCRQGVCVAANQGAAVIGWPTTPTVPTPLPPTWSSGGGVYPPLRPTTIELPTYPRPQLPPSMYGGQMPGNTGAAGPFNPPAGGGYYYFPSTTITPSPNPPASAYPVAGYYDPGITPAGSPAPAPMATPTAYITITVAQGYGGYHHYGGVPSSSSPATVTVTGLNSPQGYNSTSQGTILPAVNAARPGYNGATYIAQIYDPDQTDHVVQFSLSAVDSANRQCNVRCWDEGARRYGKCANDNYFAMSGAANRNRNDQQQSVDPIPYFHSANEAVQSRWISNGYRRYRLPDYISFLCL